MAQDTAITGGKKRAERGLGMVSGNQAVRRAIAVLLLQRAAPHRDVAPEIEVDADRGHARSIAATPRLSRRSAESLGTPGAVQKKRTQEGQEAGRGAIGQPVH